MLKKFRFPIRFKILITLLLIISIVVGVITFTMANLFHTDKTAYVHDMTSMMATSLAEESGSLLDSYRERIIVFSRIMAQRDLSRSQKNLLVKRLFEDFHEFLKQVDFLSLHVPVNDSTRGMIGPEQFELMKETAVIINCARGAVVNEKELFNALKDGKIGGACIDVYSKEPASSENFPFILLDNVICTPHLGASTQEAQVNVAALAAEQIGKLLNEGKYIDCVNKKALNA